MAFSRTAFLKTAATPSVLDSVKLEMVFGPLGVKLVRSSGVWRVFGVVWRRHGRSSLARRVVRRVEKMTVFENILVIF
jgi:hypothetical protein